VWSNAFCMAAFVSLTTVSGFIMMSIKLFAGTAPALFLDEFKHM